MAKPKNAKRAEKKHAKEKKRQKALARRGVDANRSLTDRWKPQSHGIEGLARLLKVDIREAARSAEELAATRSDAKDVWLPSRVQAMSTDALLAALAAAGIDTDEQRFTALAAGYERARLLAADHWQVPTAGVHDRDLAGQAAEELWARWLPQSPSDEALLDAYGGLEDDLYARPEARAEAILAGLEGVGPERLARAGVDVPNLLGELLLVRDMAEPDVDREARILRALRRWQALQAVGTPEWAGATLTVAGALPPGDDLVEIFACLEEDPTNGRLLGYAREVLEYEEWGPQHGQLVAAYERAIPLVGDPSAYDLRDQLEALVAGPVDPEDDPFDGAL